MAHSKVMISWRSRCGIVELNPTRSHEVAASIPGLTRWVNYPTLLRAMVHSTTTELLWRGCGCGAGWQQQFRLDP